MEHLALGAVEPGAVVITGATGLYGRKRGQSTMFIDLLVLLSWDLVARTLILNALPS